MERLPMNVISGRRLIGPVVVFLTLLGLAIVMIPGRADAGLKVRARLGGPHFGVVLDSHPRKVAVRRHLRYERIHLTQADRKIARRLARKTPYSKRVFLDLRRNGYSWRRIGAMLDIPRWVVTRTVRSVYHNQRGPRSPYRSGGLQCPR
jgi:hypothetical protein